MGLPETEHSKSDACLCRRPRRTGASPNDCSAAYSAEYPENLRVDRATHSLPASLPSVAVFPSKRQSVLVSGEVAGSKKLCEQWRTASFYFVS